VHMVTVGEERYSLPAYPVLFIFSGYGIAEVCAKFWSWRSRTFG
jgi:hypothetical protein